ncbi:DUF1289 domain-containing protein [Nitratireductor basaltis]|uniref:DUF1289 domain-containing protein n=1 Tax=Nitratireductor basaltis TaxID=472175 RepID=UPI001FCAAE64|nr:DUF1289 domain-containing protein [Nitratireductor basaltis]
MPSIQSPCISVCDIDPATGLCVGCARSLAEIVAWSSYSDAERAAVMEQLPARFHRLDGLKPEPDHELGRERN